MAVETGQAVTTAIWARLTTDASVSLYRVMAPQDPAMPYGVQRLASRDAFHGTHTYFLDWWDYGETPERVDLAVDRTKILLHEWRFVTAYGEAEGLLSFFSGGYIPTDNEKVFHYATQWDIRFVACRDVTNIVGA
jgi:hypothetical protein